MGALTQFDLKKIIKYFGIKTFFETGSGHGSGIQHASLFSFEKIISVEINENQAFFLAKRFDEDKRIKIINGDSLGVLKRDLPKLDQTPTCFWLDAHFPSADLGFRDHNDIKDLNLRVPLEQELELIFKHRIKKGINDVILCDDLNICERLPAPFEHKNWENRGIEAGRDVTCLFHEVKNLGKQFEDSHHVIREYREDHDGYLIICPKKENNVGLDSYLLPQIKN